MSMWTSRISAIGVTTAFLSLTSPGCGSGLHQTAEEACLDGMRHVVACYASIGQEAPNDFDEIVDEIFGALCADVPNTTQCIFLYECVIDLDCADILTGTPTSGCAGNDPGFIECIIPFVLPSE